MGYLSLAFLGAVQITHNDQPLAGFTYDKVRALLVYLAVEAASPQARSTLAELLWSGQSEQQARGNLRQALVRLRQVLPGTATASPFLWITRETIQFNLASHYTLDVETFKTQLAACAQHRHAPGSLCPACAQRLAEAVALYRGDFLAQFLVHDSVGFEEWVVLQREALRQQMLDALTQLTAFHEHNASYAAARRYATQLAALDPWREEAHRQLMRILARNGERAAALAQYERCCRILAADLHTEPSATTTALYHQIRTSVAEPPESGYAPPIVIAPQPALPAQPTPLIGREQELATLRQLLNDPACRLVTVAGPGGIGKTRVALAVACALAERFASGVYFIPLVAVPTVDTLVAAIAASLKVTFYGPGDPQEQILTYLREKDMLLVLDNFEHLLPGTGIVTALLEQAPQIKLVITSRTLLNIRWEWPFLLTGLSIPEQGATNGWEHCGAVQLFLNQAQRARPQGVLDASERQAIARICQMVEGWPLALELAAASTRIFTYQELVERLAVNLDLGGTPLGDVPNRHRSIQAVFDHSWSLLTESEQRILAQLTVFRGGFRRAAAEQVARAELPILTKIVEKSWLRRSSAGRYELHELLRQYAEVKLQAIHGADGPVRQRHSAYYGCFIEQRSGYLMREQQKMALAEIGLELANVQAGWRWALEHREDNVLNAYLPGLGLFYELRGRFQEGAATFQDATDHLLQPVGEAITAGDMLRRKVVGQVLGWQGAFCHKLGRYPQAQDLLQRGLVVLDQAQARAEMIFLLIVLGYMACDLGEFAAAQHYMQECLDLAAEFNDEWGRASALGLLGIAAFGLGNYAAAQDLLLQALAIYRAANDYRGIAIILNYLGSLALMLQEYEEAQRYFAASQTAAVAIEDRFIIVLALNYLGHVYTAVEADAEAERYFYEGLRLGWEIQAVPRMLDILTGLAVLRVKRGQLVEALEFVTLVQQHPASHKETQCRAVQVQTMLEARLRAGIIAQYQQIGPRRPIERVVAEVLGGHQEENYTWPRITIEQGVAASG